LGKDNKNSIDIREFQDDLKSFYKAFERLMGLSSWITTISLASLGFFLGLLINIKLKIETCHVVPHQLLAASTLTFLIIPILLGFFNMCRFELNKLKNDLRRGARGISNVLNKASEEFPLSRELSEIFRVAGDSFRKVIEEFPGDIPTYIPMWPIIGQIITLGLGLVLIVIYICLFLFLT